MDLTIATFNVNNLFRRARIMRLEGFSATSRKVLTDVRDLSELLENDSYEGSVGDRILAILNEYFGKGSKNEWFKINEVKERLYRVKRDANKTIELVAKGRKDWYGWVELLTDDIDAVCVQNTARVIDAVKADVLCVVEVEDRAALDNFNTSVLKPFNSAFSHNMLIDGNDDRGIDVGVLSQHEIVSMKSHIDDTYVDGRDVPRKIFSRDCAEYTIGLSGGNTLLMLCNHFKSKGFGSPASNDAKRKRQADRVKEILGGYDLSKDLIVVSGDFNDTPDSQPLQSLLNTKNLFDVLSSNKFTGKRWTYQDGKQIDYLLVSKPIFDSLKEVGIEQKGIFKRGNPHFDEVHSKAEQASDHAAVWATFSY